MNVEGQMSQRTKVWLCKDIRTKVWFMEGLPDYCTDDFTATEMNVWTMTR